MELEILHLPKSDGNEPFKEIINLSEILFPELGKDQIRAILENLIEKLSFGAEVCENGTFGYAGVFVDGVRGG